jgi:hypothetical protein
MYLIGNTAFLTIENLDAFPDADEIDEATYNFAMQNPNATKEEILAKELNATIEISLPEAKAIKIAELEDDFRKETMETGVVDTGLGYSVKGRYADLLNVMAIQKALELDNNSNQFIFDINNTPHQLTLNDINQIFVKFIAKGQELYLKLETLKNTVNNKLKVSTVEAVKW